MQIKLDVALVMPTYCLWSTYNLQALYLAYFYLRVIHLTTSDLFKLTGRYGTSTLKTLSVSLKQTFHKISVKIINLH